MNPSRRRAWQALEIGPLWRLRAASPGRSRDDAAAGGFFLLPDISGDWLFIGRVGSGVESAPAADASMRLLARMMAAVGLRPGSTRYAADIDAGGLAADVGLPGEAGMERNPAERGLAEREAESGEGDADEHRRATGFGPSTPRLIVALGEGAAQRLLRTDATLASLRRQSPGADGALSNIPVIVTWHPAALLEEPQRKAQAWQDLCRAAAIVAAPDTGD